MQSEAESKIKHGFTLVSNHRIKKAGLKAGRDGSVP